jgi:hypothetical protein
MDLDPRLEKIVARYHGTAHEGERQAAREVGEPIAALAGMTFDEAISRFDDRSLYDVFTLWRETNDDGVRQWERRTIELKAKLAGKTFEQAFDADEWQRQAVKKARGEKIGTFYDYEDNCEAKGPGHKAAKAADAAIQAGRAAAQAAARATRRKALIERYGSAEAALAPCERERKLLDAVRSWRKARPVPYRRWTDSVDGWSDAWTKAPAHVDAAIRTAYPLPETFASARVEYDYWRERDRELRDMLDVKSFDYRLDLLALARMKMVEALIEHELPVRTPADLLERFRLYRSFEMNDWKQEGRILSDLEGIVAALSVQQRGQTASVQRGQIAAALEASPDRTDRSIAREFGCSPTTVGRVRADLGLKDALRSVQRGGQMFRATYAKAASASPIPN